MVANFQNRVEVEQFLHDANANDLLVARNQVQTLMASHNFNLPEPVLARLAARIGYELRFRVPLPC